MWRRGGSDGSRSPELETGTCEGVFSSIRLWRGIAGVLTTVILILCILLGWLYLQRKCYYLSDTEANWNYSHSLCSLHNASLLMIENHQELSFMMKITKQDPWIGLYKRNEEFFWVNGKQLDNNLMPLILVPCSVLRKKEMRKAFVSQILLEILAVKKHLGVKDGASFGLK